MEGSSAPAAGMVAVEFEGNTSDYFKIWIVNLALTILTLGVYSPWATIRKLRYFYSHTVIAGGRFDFHANPISILIGRAIAVALLAAYYFSSYVSVIGPLIVIVIVFLLVPWLVVRSRIFRLRNTSFRSIRLNFRPDYAGAMKVFYGGALITMFSAGFAAPVAIFWKNRFMVNNSAYGRSFFKLNTTVGPFYGIFFGTIGLGLLGFLAYTVFVFIFGAVGGGMMVSEEAATDEPGLLLTALLTLPVFLVYLGVFVYSTVRHANLIYNSSHLGETRFLSSLSASDIFGLYVTNSLAIVFTLGLATPWAQIRMAKYRASKIKILLASDWQEFVADQKKAGSAAGDSIGDAFDIGVDIGI